MLHHAQSTGNYDSIQYSRVQSTVQDWAAQYSLQSMIGGCLIPGLLFLSFGFFEVENGSLDLATILLLFVIQLQKTLDDEEAETAEHRPPRGGEGGKEGDKMEGGKGESRREKGSKGRRKGVRERKREQGGGY